MSRRITFHVYGEDGLIEGKIVGNLEDEKTLSFTFEAWSEEKRNLVKMIPKPETLDRVAGLTGAFFDEGFRGLMQGEIE